MRSHSLWVNVSTMMIVEMIKNVQILTLSLFGEIAREEVEEGLHFHVEDL